MEKAYRNLGYFLILLIPLTLVGFYKTYFIQFPTFQETSGVIHAHAIIATVWILMLIAQPLLIRNRKLKWHRLLGKASYIIFPLLILSFIPQMIKLFNSENPKVLFFPMADCLILIIVYGLAIYYKRDTPKHMRFMIGSALVFLGPTIGRIGPMWLGISDVVNQNIMYGIVYLILIGLILFDRTQGVTYKPYLFIGLLWVIHQFTFNMMF